jgi:rhodanese-related sulfurtransferase
MIKSITLMMLLVLFTACVQAADVKEGVTHLSQEEFLEKSQQQNTVIIDVRTEREFSNGHIAGALNIPHGDILDDITLLDEYKGKGIIFYCHSGVRARWVTNYLNAASYGDETTIYHLKGDIRAWRARGLPLEK